MSKPSNIVKILFTRAKQSPLNPLQWNVTGTCGHRSVDHTEDAAEDAAADDLHELHQGESAMRESLTNLQKTILRHALEHGDKIIINTGFRDTVIGNARTTGEAVVRCSRVVYHGLKSRKLIEHVGKGNHPQYAITEKAKTLIEQFVRKIDAATDKPKRQSDRHP